jgi:hypothetical protein
MRVDPRGRLVERSVLASDPARYGHPVSRTGVANHDQVLRARTTPLASASAGDTISGVRDRMTVPSKAIPAPASYAVTQRKIRSMLFGHELLRIGFEEAGLHRVAANADTRNAASIRVMEKIGMRREAHFVQGSYEKGEWVDEVEYGILAAEWRAR